MEDARQMGPLAVSRHMDQVEGLLAKVRPFLEDAHLVCKNASELPLLAGYMDSRIGAVMAELQRALNAPARNVQLVRKELPQEQMEKLQKAEKGHLF